MTGEALAQPGPSLEHVIQTAGSSPVPGTDRTSPARSEYLAGIEAAAPGPLT